MADPIEDAARPVVDPSTSPVRCPLLVFPAQAAGGPDPTPESDSGPSRETTDPTVAPGPADPGIPSTANRCAASVPPAAVSLGQQRLVCFDQGHVDCPRFVRAMGSPRGASGRSGRPVATVPATVAVEAVSSPPPAAADADAARIVPVAPVVRSTRRSGARRVGSKPRPIVVASAILVAALVVAFAFTSLRGGLALPSPGASAGAAVSPSPAGSAAAVSPMASPSSEPSVVPSPSPTPSESPSPSPSQAASPTPSSAPTPTPSPSASIPPAYAGLKPCPDAPQCYLYRIHPGDNLTAIAKRFGITVTALKAANPEIKDPSLLHVGDKIRVPLPTT